MLLADGWEIVKEDGNKFYKCQTEGTECSVPALVAQVLPSLCFNLHPHQATHSLGGGRNSQGKNANSP